MLLNHERQSTLRRLAMPTGLGRNLEIPHRAIRRELLINLIGRVGPLLGLRGFLRTR